MYHDPWIYINYIMYLEDKGYKELNGLEQACYDGFSKGNTDWIPIGHTLNMNDSQNENDHDKEDNNIESIKSVLYNGIIKESQKYFDEKMLVVESSQTEIKERLLD